MLPSLQSAITFITSLTCQNVALRQAGLDLLSGLKNKEAIEQKLSGMFQTE